MKKTECPIHKIRMVHTRTKYGSRWDCPESSCTMMCWGGQTSTPADQETRTARKEAHRFFDPLYKSGPFTRSQAYKWLADLLGVPQKKAHIGMVDRETALTVAEAAKSIMEEVKQ